MLRSKAFTLAELFIALAIMGVIAVFTIPKVLQIQQNQGSKAKAKEAAASVSAAYQAYLLQNKPSVTMTAQDLLPYFNYVRIDTTSRIDEGPGYDSPPQCGSGYYSSCLVLHNGSILALTTDQFQNYNPAAIWVLFDPDGTYAGGTADGPSKSVWFALYMNGKINTWGEYESVPADDPSWFSWR